jgi:hypothetical protein
MIQPNESTRWKVNLIRSSNTSKTRMMRKTRRKRMARKRKLSEVLAEEPNPLPSKANGNLSSVSGDEIDFEYLTRIAEEADAIAGEDLPLSPTKSKSSRKKRPSLKPLRGANRDAYDTEEVDDVPPDAEQLVDPEFELMISGLVADAVDKCRDSMEWSDPGVHWKKKVGGCIARIVQKRIPASRKIPDELVLLGYLALWIVPNAGVSRGSKDTFTVGNDGFGENVQNAGDARLGN